MSKKLNKDSVSTKKSSKKPLGKKALVGIISGAVAVVLVIAATAFLFFSEPSRDDYLKAVRDTSRLSYAWRNMSIHFSGWNPVDSEYLLESRLSDLEADQKELGAAYKNLGSRAAIRKNGDLKEKYEALKDHVDTASENAKILQEAYEKIIPILIELNNNMPSGSLLSSRTIDKIGEAQKELEGLELEQKINKDYVDKVKEIYKRLEPAARDRKDGTMDFDSVRSFNSISREATSAENEWAKNIRNIGGDEDVLRKIADLHMALENKSDEGGW